MYKKIVESGHISNRIHCAISMARICSHTLSLSSSIPLINLQQRKSSCVALIISCNPFLSRPRNNIEPNFVSYTLRIGGNGHAKTNYALLNENVLLLIKDCDS